MADSILRLRVDSQEYDNKLKRAAEGIQRYAEGCRKAGGTLTQLDEGVEQFVKELGNMETVSNSARGKIGEMTKAFTELSVQYNKLTDEEKASPFGKALSESLNTLKGRIQEGKTELDDINKSLNGGGGLKDALDQVAGKFGLNIDMVTKFGGVIGVTTTALKVAKDAFFQSESNIDEWGRTVKGAEGAYDIFLQTLNNGNWSNFFSNLSQAITGARDLYDAFDRLNSIKANNAVAIATTQAEIQQLRLLKQQGQDVDDKIKEATQRLSALQSQSASAGINAGRSQVTNTLRNGVNSIGGAYINDATLKYVADKIAKGGQDYIDGMKRQYTILEKQGMVTKTVTRSDSQGNSYDTQVQVFDINALTKEQQKQYAIAKVVTERETKIQEGLTVWSQAVNEQASNAREIFRDNRYAGLSGGSRSGGGGGSGSTFDISKIVFNPNNKDVIKPSDYIEVPSVWAEYANGIKASFDSIDDSFNNLTEWTIDFKPFDEMTKKLKQEQMAFNMAGQSAQNFGAAIASIGDPSAAAAGTVIQAIANIALGFSQAAAQASKMGSYAWLAYLAAGTGAMATTINTIHSLTGYAEGGEIKGNSYSGDNIPIMANAGEIILNRAQQSNVASGLQGAGSLRGLNLRTKVKGTELLVWLDNSLAQSGRGELVTWGQ